MKRHIKGTGKCAFTSQAGPPATKPKRILFLLGLGVEGIQRPGFEFVVGQSFEALESSQVQENASFKNVRNGRELEISP